MTDRPAFLSISNGESSSLPFSDSEYESRLLSLRSIMSDLGLDYVLLTSMHNIAYYTGFLYCSFGRLYGCVVSHDSCTTISANIDYGQPNRRCYGENVVYTDWHRDNYWRAVRSLIVSGSVLGIEYDHLTLLHRSGLSDFLDNPRTIDVSGSIMRSRMVKSAEEHSLIREGARIADIGGSAVRSSICSGASELSISIAGRDAMELEIMRSFPDAEYRDTWVWFQSGLNTDGAHNPVTSRLVCEGDLLSLNTFPMISGYYTALERTLFFGEPDAETLRIWNANVSAHELGISLVRPGVSCSYICEELNRFFSDSGLLEYRTFGYGHSFGVLSHYYGRESGLELREDIDTVLEVGMVISMEPMVTIPFGSLGCGGYREHDILIVVSDGCENVTNFPYGPEHNILCC